MDWTDYGIVLSVRKHGESSAILSAMTRDQGRHGGLVRGGAGRKARGLLQPGNLLHLHWRARLADQLGSYTCEMAKAYAAPLLSDADRLAALTAACAVVDAALPEREAHPALYDGFLALLDALPGEGWERSYVAWELGLLQELGFGLDFSDCAGGGDGEDLAFVSPKSGRSVSREAGAPYAKAMLPLPGFLVGRPPEVTDGADGVTLTGFFLEKHVFGHRDLPGPRRRLAERLRTRTREG